MLDSISPYELLKASKPKSAPTLTTAYDLYSAAQSISPSTSNPAPVTPQAAAEEPPPARAQAPAPMRRTHYIADIQSRHNLAQRRAFPHP